MSLMDLIKNKKNELASKNRKKTAKIPDGTSKWRILPGWRTDGDEQFWHDFGMHYIKDAADEIQAVYICTDKTFGRECEICNTLKAAIKSSDDDTLIGQLKEAQSTGRVLLNAIHCDGPSPTEVQIAEFPPSVFEQILNIAQEWVDAGEDPFDPKAGKTFIITRTGSGKNTKYSVQIAAKNILPPADVVRKLNDLDAYVAQESADAQRKALNAVRTAAGLLAAPTVAAGVDRTRLAAPAAATTVVEDDYAVATPPKRTAAAVSKVTKPAESEITDVPDTAPVETAAAEGTGDDDLDALLASLDAK